MSTALATADSRNRLLDLLARGGARYRLLHHAPQGRTDLASTLRGHSLDQAAKSLVIRVALSSKRRRYVIAVVPGDRRVDLPAVNALYAGREASFAARDVAERLTGCVSGSIMPLSFDPDLDVIADPDLLAHEEIFFNTGRLDESVALRTECYRTLVAPRVEAIADQGA
ncbi:MULTISPECIES: YbaK/EbsC family protein [unclassified Streptomyces]|uniref:YbaK/EbsC family protein n=1 Tax=unclassified Streptomyces TaxID=2593676 RepID=UPI00372313F5